MFKRSLAKQRMNRLCSSVAWEADLVKQEAHEARVTDKNRLQQGYGVVSDKLSLAGLNLSAPVFLALSLIFALSVSWLFSFFLAWPIVPPIFALAILIPWAYIDVLADKRASEFAKDYPELLQAMASALRSGHSAQVALGNSAKLFQENNAVRVEVEKLLFDLHKGRNHHEAIADFASTRDVPELALFRKSFLLVLGDGGRFSPTLQRLAQVSRERDNLKKAVQVSTATMKMTGNILLLVCPFVLVTTSTRSENFWLELQGNTVASAIFSIGALMTILGYISLRAMGRYKP